MTFVKWMSVKQVREGETCSWWYGRAWRDYATDSTVCLPIGLNWLAGMVRCWWHAIRVGYRGKSVIDAAVNRAYLDGYELGRRSAVDEAWHQFAMGMREQMVARTSPTRAQAGEEPR